MGGLGNIGWGAFRRNTPGAGRVTSRSSADIKAAAAASRAKYSGPTGQAYVNTTPARQEAARQGITNPNQAQLNALNQAYVEGYVRPRNAAQRGMPQQPGNPNLGGGGGGGRGGGGGGGGGAALPQFTQEQLDAMAALLAQGGPQRGAALDLPDYQAFQPRAFDNSTFQNLRGQLAGAVNTDVGTAQQGTQNLMNFLTSNYRNAYTNPNNTYATAGQAPGMDTMAMQRMLQAQGVDPSVMASMMGERAGADQAFGNLWRSGAANEDMAQQGRLGTAQLSGQDAINRIRALGLGGQTGINMQEGQAKSAYDQRVEQWAREDAALQQQIAQQEAQANWQQGNEYLTQQQAYRNAQIQAMLGLLPEMKGTALNLPNAQQLGWG
jgi:hypothetical protein